jgi:hypothetical protein
VLRVLGVQLMSQAMPRLARKFRFIEINRQDSIHAASAPELLPHQPRKNGENHEREHGCKYNQERDKYDWE